MRGAAAATTASEADPGAPGERGWHGADGRTPLAHQGMGTEGRGDETPGWEGDGDGPEERGGQKSWDRGARGSVNATPFRLGVRTAEGRGIPALDVFRTA